jgi:hypothetical protein
VSVEDSKSNPLESQSSDETTASERSLEGIAHNGKPCRLVDGTGAVPPEELRALLDDLIRERRFGISGLSAAGSNAIRLGAPEFTHIQIAGELYRLIVLPYEARIEPF